MSAPVTPPPFEPSFAAALLDPGLPVPLDVVSDNAPSLSRRFAVHRNNVVAGLVEALEARFPAVEKIVGKEFFVAMARAFIQKRPPRSLLLATYGDEFAEFIGAFEPAHELPYLADVARIEAARTRAYHAADAAPLGASELAQLDAKDAVRSARRSASFAGNRPLGASGRYDLGDEFRGTKAGAD